MDAESPGAAGREAVGCGRAVRRPTPAGRGTHLARTCAGPRATKGQLMVGGHSGDTEQARGARFVHMPMGARVARVVPCVA
jgi:hypothetical protein